MEQILFKNTPITVEKDWTELKGGKEFFNSITQNVPLNQLDELIDDFTTSLAEFYSEKYDVAGLFESVIKAELISKFQNTTSRYGVVLNEGVL